MASDKKSTSIKGSRATPVRRRLPIDVSVTGMFYILMMFFMGLAAMNTQANLLFGVFGLMIGILLVSGIISRIVLKKLRVDRRLPEYGVVGDRATITYEFTNQKRYWPSLSVCMAELDGAEAFTKQPQSYMLHAAAKTSAVVPIDVVPKRRGLHTLSRYQLSTSFPFGFIKRAREHEHSETLLIYPALATVDPKLLTLCRSAETSGAMMRPRRGGMDEFYGVKEFRTGENPRFIYWRRSARTGVLVSKEMTQVSPPRLLLLIDTMAKDTSVPARAEVERAIAMAASLANHALEAGLLVGLYAWSDEWTGMHPNRGKRHRRDLLAALSRMPMNLNHGTRELIDNAQQFMKTGTTPVLFTPNDVQLALGDTLRSGMVTVSSPSPQAAAWFKFAPQVDFTRCMPIDQDA